MKTAIKISILFTALTVLFFACQKEVSFEVGNTTPSVGSLQTDGSGGCLGAVVFGTYVKDVALNNTHFANVNVLVDSVGTYTISTDTVQGYYFIAKGSFTATGAQVVKLIGGGTPLSAGTHIFTLKYNGTICEFSVAVSGTAPSAAAFTVNCTTAAPAGTFQQGTAMTSANKVVLNVNVTTVGSWNITTAPAVNGVTFSGSGTFTTTGAQTITLTASGTPAGSGSFNFPVVVGTVSCNFSITFTASTTGPATYTVNCTTAVPAGTYQQGVVMTSANTVTLTVNVTAIGTWSISTAPAVNGVTFIGSGSFTTTGSQTIVLTASGTPAGTGSFNFPVLVGATSCNFSITFIAPLPPDYYPRTTNSNWSYQYDGNPNDSILIRVIAPTLSAIGNTYNIFIYTPDASLGYDSSGYYRKSGSNYYEWLDMGTYIGLNEKIWMEYNFLKDNQIAGATWNTANIDGTYTPSGGSPTAVTLRWKFTILQQDVPITVNSVVYPNTIVVKQDLEQLVSGTWALAGYYKNYFSRDKGLIKQEVFNSTDVLQYTLDVRRLVIY